MSYHFAMHEKVMFCGIVNWREEIKMDLTFPDRFRAGDERSKKKSMKAVTEWITTSKSVRWKHGFILFHNRNWMNSKTIHLQLAKHELVLTTSCLVSIKQKCRSIFSVLFFNAATQCLRNFFLFFSSIWVFSRTLAIRRTAEGWRTSPFFLTTSTRSRKLRHLFAVMHLRCLPRIFNHSACNYQTVTRWDLSSLGNKLLTDLTHFLRLLLKILMLQNT